MPTVVRFLAEGASASVTENGLEATEVFMVSDLAGDPGTLCVKALEADGIPRQADPHPGSPLLRAASVVASLEPETHDACRVTVSYKANVQDQSGGDQPQISFGASLIEVETNLDKDGKGLSVTYRNTDPKKDTINPQDVDIHGTGTVQVQVPLPVFRLTRRENASPEERVRRFVGKVNSSSWRNGAARTWLCTNISGDSDDNGRTYRVTYEFQYKDATWDATLVFQNQDGSIPANVSENPINGVLKGIQLLETEDFGELNLG